MWFLFILLAVFSITYGYVNIFKYFSKVIFQWRIKPIIAGFLFFSAITSLPELFVAFYSLSREYSVVPLPTITGSNVVNYTVLLALLIVRQNIKINATAKNEDLWAEMIVSLVLFFNFLITSDVHFLSMILVVILFILYGYLVRKSKTRNRDKLFVPPAESMAKANRFAFTQGIVFTIVGSILLTEGTLSLSSVSGVNAVVFSFMLIGLIASIPEIFLLMYLINDNQIAAALSTISGSGVFNWVIGLAVPYFFSGAVLDETIQLRSLFGIYYLVLILAFILMRIRGNKELIKTDAGILILLYCLSVLALFYFSI